MRLLVIVLLTCTTAAAARASSPVVLAMTMEKNLPRVQISVNGTPGLTFIVDSAAWGCLISGERAAAMGLKPTVDAISSGSGGLQSVGIIPGLRLDLGGLQLEPMDCYTFDMSTLRFKSRVDGVLGFPLFRKFIVEIDYPSGSKKKSQSLTRVNEMIAKMSARTLLARNGHTAFACERGDKAC